MGIKVAWDDPQNTIIRYDLEGLWNWDDYRDAVAQSTRMMRNVGYPVAIIANFNGDTMVPTGHVMRETKMARTKKMNAMPENVGPIVITGGNAFVEVMVSGFCKIYNHVEKNFFAANTLDDARRLIGEQLARGGSI